MVSILHVVPSIDPRAGGVAESIRARGLQLQKDGHHVEVVSLDDPDSDAAKAYALPLHALGKGYSKWQYKPGLTRWIADNASRFDAVVVDGLWQYHGFAVWRALRGRKNTPYFVFPHGMLDPWFNTTYPLKKLKKLLFWRWCEYRVLRDARAVLFTCEAEKVLARQSFTPYRVNEQVVPFGTEPPPQEPSAEVLREQFLVAHPELQGKRILLFLGRIHPKKGVDLLIDAFCNAPALPDDAVLAIAGPAEPELQRALNARAQRSSRGKRVHWLGMLYGPDKWAALHACDAFALISHQENFGIAVAEAMACGKPVLISNKVNIWTEISAAKAGWVDDDTAAGASRLVQIWATSTSHERQIGSAHAQAGYNRHFSITAMADGLVKCVADLQRVRMQPYKS